MVEKSLVPGQTRYAPVAQLAVQCTLNACGCGFKSHLAYVPYINYNVEMNNYMKERYARRRGEWIVKLGGSCVQCGTTEKLEFDHIDPTTKEYSVARILSGGSEAKVSSEMAKCQLLCNEHHKDKTKQDRLINARP